MEWRTVSANPAYEVSDCGQVRRTSTGRVIVQRLNDKGYANVETCHEGKRKHYRVARLVCEAWHGPPPFSKAQAAHLDGNKLNNVPSNLAWTTNKENARHRILHGTQPCGTSHGLAKLSEQDVRRIRSSRLTNEALAEELGVGSANICHIRKGRLWRHVQ